MDVQKLYQRIKRSDWVYKNFFDCLRNLIVRCRLILDNYNFLSSSGCDLQSTSIFLRAVAISVRSTKCSIFDWQNQKLVFIFFLKSSLVCGALPEKLEGKHSLIISGFFKNSNIFLKFSLMGGLWRFIFLFYRSLRLKSVLVCSDNTGRGNAFLSFDFLSGVLKG